MDALGTNCFSETCPVLKLQSWENTAACTKAQQAKEDVGNNAWLPSLPGGMAVH